MIKLIKEGGFAKFVLSFSLILIGIALADYFTQDRLLLGIALCAFVDTGERAYKDLADKSSIVVRFFASFVATIPIIVIGEYITNYLQYSPA